MHIFFLMDIDGHKTASRNKNEQFRSNYLLLCTMKVFINLEEERTYRIFFSNCYSCKL